MDSFADLQEKIARGIDRQRLLKTAIRLVGVPSRTGDAGAVLDQLASDFSAEGFPVDRHPGGHPSAPAVAVTYSSGQPGPTLQFNGHLDTVHLPFVPPAVHEGRLTGSGSADMKGGTAAAIEALRVLRDGGLLPAGKVLFTAHDLHEAPWGTGEQLDTLIRDGVVGDAVLLPEPLCGHLPVAGRGSATWKVTFRRKGAPVHEVMRPLDEPSVIAAGAQMVQRLASVQDRLRFFSDPVAGTESVFVGQIHSGEIFNQYPQECWLEGTRRWLAGQDRAEVELDLRKLITQVGKETGTDVDIRYQVIRDAFHLSSSDPLVMAFQGAYQGLTGKTLAEGPKPFVDDGNSFYGLRGIPCITHGPLAGGQHTVAEWVDIDDMVRVATLYAMTAVLYCGRSQGVA